METLNGFFSSDVDPKDYDARVYSTRDAFKDALIKVEKPADADETRDAQIANTRESQGTETGGFIRRYDGNAHEIGAYELRRARVYGADGKIHHNIIVIVKLENWKRAHVVFYARRYDNARKFLAHHFPQVLVNDETTLECTTPEITLYARVERVNNRILGNSAVSRYGYLHQTPAERWFL